MGIETFPINAAYRVSDSVQAGPRQMLGAWHKEANAKGKALTDIALRNHEIQMQWLCHYLPQAN